VAAAEHHGAFGQDAFGRWAEKTARFFGTPQYIVGQTIVVALWVVVNSVAVIRHWDPYPFILLNLGFSLQAAYAAPLILLAQTRQADRDKVVSDATESHREREEQLGRERVAAIKTETPRFMTPPAPVPNNGRRGELGFEAKVNTDGLIVDVRTLKNTTGSEPLALANAEALKSARFYPLIQNRTHIAFTYQHHVYY